MMCSRNRFSSDRYTALILSLIVTLPIGRAIAQAQHITANPSFIDRGVTAEIQFGIAHWQPGDQINISPGGPFQVGGLSLSKPPHFLSRDGDIIYAASTDGAVYRTQIMADKLVLLAEAKLPGPISRFNGFADTLISVDSSHGIALWHWPAGKSPRLSSSLPISAPLAGIQRDKDQLTLITQHGAVILCRIELDSNGIPRLRKRGEWPLNSPVSAFSVANERLYFTGPNTGLGIAQLSANAAPQVLGRFTKLGAAGRAVSVLNDKTYVGDQQDGLVVYDVSTPNAIRWLGSNGKSGGLTAVNAAQDYVYGINRGRRLLSLDTGNPELPITGSYFQLTGIAHDLIRMAQRLIVATDQGIQIIDFSQPSTLQISNEGINHGGSRRGFIRDGIAYVADWFSGLHIYDMHLPYAPRHIGNFHTAGSSKGVVVDGDLAYVGDDDHGLQIINISDPRHPKKVSEIATRGLAYTLVKRGKLIYLADHRGGIDIIDMATPKHPQLIGSFATPSKAWAIDVKDRHAYVADDASGLLIFDVANPARIRQIAQFNPGGQAEDVVIQGNLAHVTFFEGKHSDAKDNIGNYSAGNYSASNYSAGNYSIIDISNPLRPRLVGNTPIPGNARAVRLQGNYAFIAAWEGGLQVVDIHDLQHPKVVAALDTDGSTWGVDVDGANAYLWDWWGGIKVADISDPLQPRLISRYQAAFPIQAFAAQNNFLFAANGSRGLQAYDITNPINPIWATALDLPGVALDVAISGKRAFVAMGDAGVGVADIENPFQLNWITRINTLHAVTRIRASANGLLADDGKTLSLIDIQDPQHPRLVKQLNIPLNDIWLDGTTALLSRHQQGLQLLDISDLATPHELAHYGQNTEFQQVRSQGDILALVREDQGIQLLRRDAQQVTELAFIPHPQSIQDLQFLGDDLYVASEVNGLQRFSLSKPTQPQLLVSYPATGPMTHLLINTEAAFFAGDTNITSITLLPKIRFNKTQTNQLSLSLPADMPLGSYHIYLIDTQGVRYQQANAFQVRLPKSKKPKFTLDDFNRILEQRRQHNPRQP